MKKINNTRKKEIKRRLALALVNMELKIKYPKNSIIVFNSVCKNGEKIPVTVSCSWYNKKGRPDGKLPKSRDIMSGPPEWQNIPYEEAQKIAEMFDKNMFWNLRYMDREDVTLP